MPQGRPPHRSPAPNLLPIDFPAVDAIHIVEDAQAGTGGYGDASILPDVAHLVAVAVGVDRWLHKETVNLERRNPRRLAGLGKVGVALHAVQATRCALTRHGARVDGEPFGSRGAVAGADKPGPVRA